jgi:hypothetical protein
MNANHPLEKTARRILDYLRGFQAREDIYALEKPDRAADPAGRFVRSNREAFNDLGMGGVLEQVFAAVPRKYEKGRVIDREYVEDLFRNPTFDRDEIAQRQEAISELQHDEALWNQVLAVKSSLDTCLCDERYRSAVQGLRPLQDASNVVGFVLAIRGMRKPVAQRLKRVKDLGARFDADARFREVERFMEELYSPYGIGDAIDDNMDYLGSISSVGSRRGFYGANRILLEATERMLSEEPFRQFINDEARSVKLLSTMKSKLDLWHKEMFRFHLTGASLEAWGKNERKQYRDLMEYWLLLVNEAVYSRMPKLEVGDLTSELGFYLGAAALQRKWEADNFPVTLPVILERREIRATVTGACNTSLMERLHADRIVRNDICSDRDHNLFVVTGPNNGGKTTYIRQIGQMYWLAHLGMGIPARQRRALAPSMPSSPPSTRKTTPQRAPDCISRTERESPNFSARVGSAAYDSLFPCNFLMNLPMELDHEESVKRTKIDVDVFEPKRRDRLLLQRTSTRSPTWSPGANCRARSISGRSRQNGNAWKRPTGWSGMPGKTAMATFREAMGITAESLQRYLQEEIGHQNLYSCRNTRMRNMREQ